MLVSIIIPTQRRPAQLDVAVRSVLVQTGVDSGKIELIIADNDAVPSAKAQATGCAAEALFPVTYVHEPEAGVANVRNTALAQSKGALIAFLDDDQAAPAGWLADLLAAQKRLDADVVFGPVRARALEAMVAHRPYLEWFFSHEGPAQEQVIDVYYGCGNSLLRRASLPCDPPFRACEISSVAKTISCSA